MKKSVIAIFCLMLVVAIPSIAQASVFSLSLEDLMSPSFADQGISSRTSEIDRYPIENNSWVKYNIGAWWGQDVSGEATIRLGDAGTNDLSGFDSYALKIKNMNQEHSIYANLFLDTGSLYATEWLLLAPGEMQVLDLDFTVNGVSNLSNVSNIGFQVSIPGDDGSWANGVGKFKMAAAPVSTPEPATMLLFGPALLGLVGFKRKKS